MSITKVIKINNEFLLFNESFDENDDVDNINNLISFFH